MAITPTTPQDQTIAVVFIGAFNPRIFHPLWFEKEGLIRPEEFSSALDTKQDGPIVLPSLSRVTIGPDISFECLEDKMQISTATTLSEQRLRKVCSDILTKLPHTPITAVGINHTLVYPVPDERTWHRVGDVLVPKKEIWDKLMPNRPGMAVVRVQEIEPGPPRVRILVTVQPLRDSPFRFQLGVNWHGEIKEDSTSERSTVTAEEFLQSQWARALDFAPNVAKELFSAL